MIYRSHFDAGHCRSKVRATAVNRKHMNREQICAALLDTLSVPQANERLRLVE